MEFALFGDGDDWGTPQPDDDKAHRGVSDLSRSRSCRAYAGLLPW